MTTRTNCCRGNSCSTFFLSSRNLRVVHVIYNPIASCYRDLGLSLSFEKAGSSRKIVNHKVKKVEHACFLLVILKLCLACLLQCTHLVVSSHKSLLVDSYLWQPWRPDQALPFLHSLSISFVVVHRNIVAGFVSREADIET